MKLITASLSLLFFLVLATPASAETYGYIDTNGSLRIVTAETALLAIEIAPNIAHDSGVMLMTTEGLARISTPSVTELSSSNITEDTK